MPLQEDTTNANLIQLKRCVMPKTLIDFLRQVDFNKHYMLKTRNGLEIVQFKMDFYNGFFQMIRPSHYEGSKLRSHEDLKSIQEIYEIDDLMDTIKDSDRG